MTVHLAPSNHHRFSFVHPFHSMFSRLPTDVGLVPWTTLRHPSNHRKPRFVPLSSDQTVQSQLVLKGGETRTHQVEPEIDPDTRPAPMMSKHEAIELLGEVLRKTTKGTDVHVVYLPEKSQVDHMQKQEVWAGVNEKAETGEQVEESQVREIPEHDRDMRFLPVELRGIPVMAPARKNGGGDKRKREVEVLPMGQRLVVGPEEQERMEEREANQSEKVRKSLPPGWQVRAKLRRSGPSAGHAFHYSFISPDRKFRCPSFARVKAYLIEHARISREAHAANKSDGNDDHCSSCLKDGELVCCDGCPSSWHLECLEKGKEEIGSTFYCPNCVFCKQ